MEDIRPIPQALIIGILKTGLGRRRMEEEMNLVKTAHPFWNQDAEPPGNNGFVNLKIENRAFARYAGPFKHEVANQGSLHRSPGCRFYRSRPAGVKGPHGQTGGERFRVE